MTKIAFFLIALSLFLHLLVCNLKATSFGVLSVVVSGRQKSDCGDRKLELDPTSFVGQMCCDSSQKCGLAAPGPQGASLKTGADVHFKSRGGEHQCGTSYPREKLVMESANMPF